MTKNAPAGRRANRTRDVEPMPVQADAPRPPMRLDPLHTRGTPTGGSASTEANVPVINVTPHLIVLGPVERLRTLFALHVSGAAADDKMRRRRGDTTISTATLDTVLAERLATIDEMTRQDFVDAFTFFDGFSNQWIDEAKLARARAALRLDTRKKTRLVTVNRWLKYVYLMLWVDGVVRFPLAFRMSVSFGKDELRQLLPPVAACHLDNPNSHALSFGVALVLATGWRTFADVDLDVIGPLSAEIVLAGKNGEIGGLHKRTPSSSFQAVLTQMAKAGEGLGIRFSLRDLKGYQCWVERRRQGFEDPKPFEFIANEAELRRAHSQKRKDKYMRRIAAAQLELVEDDNRDELRNSILAGEKGLREVNLEVLANRVDGPGDIREYMRALRIKGNYRNRDCMYPTRMHAFPTETWAKWDKLLEMFCADRQRQGAESGSGDASHRLIFQDYLCCYLPWWIELHPGVDVTLPADPSLFGRFGYWTEGAEGALRPSLWRTSIGRPATARGCSVSTASSPSPIAFSNSVGSTRRSFGLLGPTSPIRSPRSSTRSGSGSPRRRTRSRSRRRRCRCCFATPTPARIFSSPLPSGRFRASCPLRTSSSFARRSSRRRCTRRLTSVSKWRSNTKDAATSFRPCRRSPPGRSASFDQQARMSGRSCSRISPASACPSWRWRRHPLPGHPVVVQEVLPVARRAGDGAGGDEAPSREHRQGS